MSCAKFGRNLTCGYDEENENVKRVNKRTGTDEWMDDGQQVIRNSAQVS